MKYRNFIQDVDGTVCDWNELNKETQEKVATSISNQFMKSFGYVPKEKAKQEEKKQVAV